MATSDIAERWAPALQRNAEVALRCVRGTRVECPGYEATVFALLPGRHSTTPAATRSSTTHIANAIV